MSESKQSTELLNGESINNSENQFPIEKNCNMPEDIPESSEISSNEPLLENSTNIPKSTESFQTEDGTKSKNLDTNSVELTNSNDEDTEDEWIDITGSGNFKKKVIEKGLGPDTRPKHGDRVTADIFFYVNGTLFEEHQDVKLIVGDLDMMQGIDMVLCLIETKEKAKVIIPSKLAYGNKGRLPEVPPDAEIECDIEVKEVESLDLDSLSLSEKLKLGNDKRLRGNYFYERGEFIEAIHCYERAVEYLDAIHDCSGVSAEQSQEIVDMRIKVYNNMAASHMKLSAYSAALKSVELVLKVQPKNVKALFRKAKILGAQGSTDEAIMCLRLAANLEPETKIIQVELSKYKSKKKREEESQKAMYQRMFPQSVPQKSSSFSKALKWSMVTGGVLALAVGMAAYRQYHS
ncbi:peptidyl-prolyl cis-trans isomerase FKBP8-like [Argiope bruennichi]|uniref:peptidylprolyl isomerase n=1 Tax=Argiope bruennichi TaxID=94029 RepID=A0A8T0FVX3_ARGBR|nr:peptidyl-prolyl cis-trans isomerase FKBP8-like [Argiope bruennichi]KAF8795241.1 Peptidyl-prolyl cis-trans isomerase FKBP8 like protein [Argiope bruennichi]